MASSDTVDTHSYISVDHTRSVALDERELADWLAVLRRLDGKRSINEILAELNLPQARIRQQLEEALDYQIITFDDAFYFSIL